MKILRQLAFIPLLFLVLAMYGQKNNRFPPPTRMLSLQEAAKEKRNHNCARTGNETFTSRIKRYPFNSYCQAQVVSYDGVVNIDTNGEFVLYNEDQLLLQPEDTTAHLPVESLSLLKPLWAKEVISLTMPQIDTLTDILYNYGYAGPIISYRTKECYDPHNAILFWDGNGRALAFIEVCFECQETRLSDEHLSLGEMCDQKLDMLKTLFRKVGIKYGVERGAE